MDHLAPANVVTLLAGLAILLGSAVVLGEIARRLRQPAIVGEVLAGIILGPSVLGLVSPGAESALFPVAGTGAIALETFTTIAVVLLLFVAGLEIDLSAMRAYGRKAAVVSLSGIVIPFTIGGITAYYWPNLVGRGDIDRVTFALFFAIALAISALPVIAKTLMDLDLLRTRLGTLVITAAMVDDLIGWLGFSVVLGMMSADASGHRFAVTLALVLLTLVVIFALVRPFVNRVLPWVQGRLVWPGGVLGFMLVMVFAFAALTEAIGVHAIMGAFFIGIAIGDSPHLRQRTREIVHYFVMHVFAPVFFATIGLHANIARDFNLGLVAFVLVIATVGKVAGGSIGARLGGLSMRESFAIGFGLNARGAMEIILALLALQHGVIEDQLFVALVIMALVTSMISGPTMDRLLIRRRRVRLLDVLDGASFVPDLVAETMDGAVSALARIAAKRTGRPEEEIVEAVRRRERIAATGIGNGIAIPHARLDGLRQPAVIFGRSLSGIDAGASDETPVHLVFLLLTSREDQITQLELLSDIAARFESAEMRHAVMRTRNYNELLAEMTVSDASAGTSRGGEKVKDTAAGGR